MQDEMARWRFEALKLRYLILNREALLEANGVAFEADVPNITQHINKMNPALHEPNVFIDLKKIHHLVSSSVTVPQTSAAKVCPKTENKENNFEKPIKIEVVQPHVQSNQSKNPTKSPFKCKKSPIAIKQTPIVKTESVERLNAVVKPTATPCHSSNHVSSSNPVAAPRMTPVRAPFVPQYRTITLTPAGMSTLSRNIAQLKETPSKSITRDLFPAVENKKVVNFSQRTVGGDDPTAHDIAGKIKNSAEDISRKPLTEYVVKRIFVKSKKPKRSGNFQ